ncbi:hypothetical protein MASR2M12_00060 [Bacteroidales bacterium]
MVMLNTAHRFFKRLLPVLLFLPLWVFSQDNTVAQSSLSDLLTPPKIQSLSNCFDEMVTLEIPTEQGTFRKQQASQLFQSFLKLYPADSIRIRKQGLSGGDSRYLIGDYYSGNTTFYIYIVSRRQLGQELIFNLNLNKK